MRGAHLKVISLYNTSQAQYFASLKTLIGRGSAHRKANWLGCLANHLSRALKNSRPVQGNQIFLALIPYLSFQVFISHQGSGCKWKYGRMAVDTVASILTLLMTYL